MKRTPANFYLRSVKKLILLSFPAAIVSVLVIEVLLYLAGYKRYYLDGDAFIPSDNPEILYELRPRFSGRYAGTPVAINSHGLRGADYVTGNCEHVFRIAIVGDSVAFGQGVGEGYTLADQLEKELKSQSNLKSPYRGSKLWSPGIQYPPGVLGFQAKGRPVKTRCTHPSLR